MSHDDIYSFELPELNADGTPVKDDTYNIYKEDNTLGSIYKGDTLMRRKPIDVSNEEYGKLPEYELYDEDVPDPDPAPDPEPDPEPAPSIPGMNIITDFFNKLDTNNTYIQFGILIVMGLILFKLIGIFNIQLDF